MPTSTELISKLKSGRTSSGELKCRQLKLQVTLKTWKLSWLATQVLARSLRRPSNSPLLSALQIKFLLCLKFSSKADPECLSLTILSLHTPESKRFSFKMASNTESSAMSYSKLMTRINITTLFRFSTQLDLWDNLIFSWSTPFKYY